MQARTNTATGDEGRTRASRREATRTVDRKAFFDLAGSQQTTDRMPTPFPSGDIGMYLIVPEQTWLARIRICLTRSCLSHF